MKNVELVQIGQYLMDAWYYSPYPDEVSARFDMQICMVLHGGVVCSTSTCPSCTCVSSASST